MRSRYSDAAIGEPLHGAQHYGQHHDDNGTTAGVLTAIVTVITARSLEPSSVDGRGRGHGGPPSSGMAVAPSLMATAVRLRATARRGRPWPGRRRSSVGLGQDSRHRRLITPWSHGGGQDAAAEDVEQDSITVPAAATMTAPSLCEIEQ